MKTGKYGKGERAPVTGKHSICTLQACSAISINVALSKVEP